MTRPEGWRFAISWTGRIALAAALERFLARNPHFISGYPARLPEGPWPPDCYGEWVAIIGAAVAPAWRPADGHDQTGRAPGQTTWRQHGFSTWPCWDAVTFLL